ncbi:hypothetical protein [Thermococcus sp.]
MKKRTLLGIFVVLLLIGFVSENVFSFSSTNINQMNSRKTCGLSSGQVVAIDSLVGVPKSLAIHAAQQRLSRSKYLKTHYRELEFSKALAWSSLLMVNEKLIRRDVVVIPVKNNTTTALVYLRDTQNTPTILAKEVILHEKLFILEINPNTKSIMVKTIVQPLDGWSPICSSTICTTDADCPDRTSEGLYFPSCSDDCKDCTNWDYYCVAVYALNAGVCSVSCASCVLTGNILSCVGCLACVLMTPYTEDIFGSCCKGQVIRKCLYYEWWD